MTESDTDTEVIVKLLKLIYDRDQQSGNEKKLSFPELVEQVILQLVSRKIDFFYFVIEFLATITIRISYCPLNLNYSLQKIKKIF